MSKRKIIKIDEKKCDGCGKCIPACPEGAIQIINGKARLISDLFCDGLGACLGDCPLGAITIEEREALAYSEREVIERIVGQGKDVIKAHLKHLDDHGEEEYLQEAFEYLKEQGIENPLENKTSIGKSKEFCGCPGSKIMDFREGEQPQEQPASLVKQDSELRQWPIQLMLVPSEAPYFNNADLIIVADCVPFAYANFHQDFLKGNLVAIGCPKLDEIKFYKEKIGEILRLNEIKSLMVVHMEVPCCFGLKQIVEEAVTSSAKAIKLKTAVITVRGQKLQK